MTTETKFRVGMDVVCTCCSDCKAKGIGTITKIDRDGFVWIIFSNGECDYKSPARIQHIPS